MSKVASGIRDAGKELVRVHAAAELYPLRWSEAAIAVAETARTTASLADWIDFLDRIDAALLEIRKNFRCSDRRHSLIVTRS